MNIDKNAEYHFIDTVLSNRNIKLRPEGNQLICSFLCLKIFQSRWGICEGYPDDLINYIMILLFNNIIEYPCCDIICKYYWYIGIIECGQDPDDFYHCGICHKTGYNDYMKYEICNNCKLKVCSKNGKCIVLDTGSVLCVRCAGQRLIRKGTFRQWVTFDESLVNDFRRYKPGLK